MRIGLVSIAGVALAMSVGMARAAGQASCAGDACADLVLSADGCSRSNKGGKALKYSLFAKQGAGRPSDIVAILKPGETFKEPDKRFCLKPSSDLLRYEANYIGGPKPSPPAPVAAPAIAVAVGATLPPIPRAKPPPPPQLPPLPREKPELIGAPPLPPVPREKPELARMPEPASATASVEAPPAPPPPSANPTSGCGNACHEILFKMVGECLWVQSQNPRPIAFEAEVGGRRMTLALEGANAAKADARTAQLAGEAAQAAAEEAAYHTRIGDPFLAVSAGIPVYRARLGPADACVKGQAEITRFTARFAR